MKKTLIITLALVFVLGITGAAFAAPANPFVDVPANHWAYSAVSKLAKDGVIDGMGDGTYQGGRSITRYEMAQMVAKAMVNVDKADAGNRALIKKLEAEFATELNNLGVRVKALEDRVGTIKINGDARIRYRNLPAKAGNAAVSNEWAQRFRIFMNAKVNENTTFYGRLQAMNHNLMGTSNVAAAGGSNDRVKVIDANFTTKNIFSSGASLTAGRFSQRLGSNNGNFMGSPNGMVDGAKVVFGNKTKATIGYARFGAAGTAYYSDNGAAFVEIAGNITDKIGMTATYLQESSANKAHQMKIWGIGANAKLGSNFGLFGEYFANTGDGTQTLTGSDAKYYSVRLAYKGANRAVPQSWGAFVEYRKVDPYMIDGGLSDSSVPMDNVKGIVLSGSLTLAKNIVMDAYYTINDKRVSDGADRGSLTRLQVNYFF